MPFHLHKKDKEKGKETGHSETAPLAHPPEAVASSSQTPATTVDQQTDDFRELKLKSVSGFPTVETCLAHLRFLSALHALKEDIGYSDGVFGLLDELADDNFSVKMPEGKEPTPKTEQEMHRARLSRVREKRWTLFVARAVDRYAAWWDALPQKERLREDDMLPTVAARDKRKYILYPSSSRPLQWTTETLLPLDVLMVLHAHMLNPRDFLEDTMRFGLGDVWSAGFPWHLINPCLRKEDSTGDLVLDVPDTTKQAWEALTKRRWDNVDDSLDKTIACPFCGNEETVPWTTCTRGDSLVGKGWGDGNFWVRCSRNECGRVVTKKLLAMEKFVKDVRGLTTENYPMPGTVLSPTTGCPETATWPLQHCPRLFANRMVRTKLASDVLDCLDYRPSNPSGSIPYEQRKKVTMEWIRDAIAKILVDPLALREINEDPELRCNKLPEESRIGVRKMMSHYWDNPGPFALDLTGAVLRQGLFVDKMQRLDWLHCPTTNMTTTTMQRLIVKYERFVGLLAAHPGQTCVPTLDVDLAWHTHQLSPQHYYAYTVRRTQCDEYGNRIPLKVGRFVNHDDKIDQDRLHLAFAFTTKAYQDKYDELYSACTCWYCEAIRAASSGRLLGLSHNDRLVDQFYTSGAAHQCPPDRSAHISAHNAVVLQTRQYLDGAKKERNRRDLENNYKKAVKRAAKKGRQLPSRDEYYDQWGYSYYMYSPYVYTGYYSPGVSYAPDPAAVPNGSGVWGGCANGSCGSAVGSGALGGLDSVVEDFTGLLCSDCSGDGDGGDGGDGGGCGGCGG